MPYVEIYDVNSGEVLECMGPHDQRKAERIKSGAEINLNHDEFAIRIVEESTK